MLKIIEDSAQTSYSRASRSKDSHDVAHMACTLASRTECACALGARRPVVPLHVRSDAVASNLLVYQTLGMQRCV